MTLIFVQHVKLWVSRNTNIREIQSGSGSDPILLTYFLVEEKIKSKYSFYWTIFIKWDAAVYWCAGTCIKIRAIFWYASLRVSVLPYTMCHLNVCAVSFTNFGPFIFIGKCETRFLWNSREIEFKWKWDPTVVSV